MKDIHAILKAYWGHPDFRPLQEEIIHAIMRGEDSLALLPTGGGKSICFQVPAMAMDGLCLVISPLIALMKDQVENLQQREIPALAIYSGMSHRAIDVELDNCIKGKYKFLYCSPERLKTELFRARLPQMNINFIAIDEAHCISQWGYDFRPEYLQIAETKKLLNKSVIALTATATERVVEDIQKRLEFKKPQVFQKSFERRNLAYVVLHEEQKQDRMLSIAKSIKGSGIVYARNRRLCRDLSEYLWQHQVSADYYHAGLKQSDRDRKQEQWISGKTKVMVATNAFGMGIDKSDVRFVIHYELPDSLEGYYQEAGRAGRDELKAYCVALYREQDKHEAYQQWEQNFPDHATCDRIYQLLCSYLKIPLHAGEGISYDFDLGHFSKHSGENGPGIMAALRLMELEGALKLSDAMHQPSRIMMRVDHTQLYDFEIRNNSVAPLIKLLLRSYGGLFDQFVNIKEAYLAQQLRTTEEEIIKVLLKFQEIGLLHYEVRKDHPQITFLRAREDKLFLDREKIKFRQDLSKTKLDAVFLYAELKEGCRSRQLLSYFDEREAPRCGHCDLCLEDKKKKYDHTHYQEAIQACLQAGINELSEIVRHLGVWHEDALRVELREMVDEGILKLEDDNTFTWQAGKR